MLDVIVVGAGPAGSATAALLGRLGYKVEVWEKAMFPRHRIGESLPPRAVALLEHLRLETPGFAVMEGHTSIWGKSEPHRAVFQDGYGLQVERDRFDQMLLEQSKAKVRFGRAATGVIREDGRVVGVRYRDSDPHPVLSQRERTGRARFVIMATGPKTGTRHLKQSAIFGYWKNSQHPEGSQANDTIIESFPDGWVWSLRLSSDLRNVTVLFDPLTSSAVRDRRYSEAIAKTSFVRGLVANAQLASKPTGCDASWLCVEKFAEPGMLLVGDAGSVIDPLSSQGVYKALCSAIAATAVVNTCLRKQELEDAALRFYNEEERRTYDAYAAGGVATFRAEQRWPSRPFWKRRHALVTWDIKPRKFDSQFANAIEAGRANEHRLRNTKGVTVAQRPTMSGAFIELSEYVVTPRFDYGYRGPYAAMIVDLHRTLASPMTINEILQPRNGREAASFLKVIAYMYREGLVETA